MTRDIPLSVSLSAGPPGTDARIICPKCDGGSDRERCMSVHTNQDGSISFKCWRSQCGFWSHKTDRTGAKVQYKEPKHYTRPYKALNDDQAAVIAQRFGLPDDSVDGYSEADDRFILGVSGPTHQNRGVIAYSLSGGKPKSVTYNAMPDEPFVHWAFSTKAKAIVVVEDWFSAEKVREADQIGVAIMGTNLTIGMVIELAIVASKRALPTYIALDRDAFGKAVGYVGKYKEQFGNGLYVWSLEKDLKYVGTNEIKKAVIDGARAEFTERFSKGSQSI